MSTMTALTATEARLFVRDWGVLVFAFVFPPLMMLILAGVFAGEGNDEVYGATNGTDYYIAAYLAIPIAAVAFTGLPTMLATYRELGVLRRFEASGVTASRVVLAQAAVAFLSVVAGALLVLATAAPVYGVPAVENPTGVVLVLLAGAGALLTLGIVLGLAVPTVRASNAIGMLVFLPMFILGGGGPPAGVMTPTMRDIADALPLTHVTAGLREAWLYGDAATAALVNLGLWWAAGLALVFAVTSVQRRRD